MSVVFLLFFMLNGYILCQLLFKSFFADLEGLFQRRGLGLSLLPFKLTVSFISGTIISVTLLYFISLIFALTNMPLLFSGLVFLLLCLALYAGSYFLLPGARKQWQKALLLRRKSFWQGLVEDIRKHKLIILGIALIFILYVFLFYLSFRILPGNSIFSGIFIQYDFGHHLSLIRSFSHGTNIPADYPYFSGQGINYHFLFYFMAGFLEYWGFSLDHALNVPSSLGALSLIISFYYLFYFLVKSHFASFFGNLLLLFNSSFAFYIFLFENKAWLNIFDVLAKRTVYLGAVYGEEWGMFNLNTLMNQRHFIFCLPLLVFACFFLFRRLFLFQKKEQDKPSFLTRLKDHWLSKKAWLPQDLPGYLFFGVLLGISSYWNGAILLSCLMILAVSALFCKRRLEYLLMAVLTVLLSLALSKIFSQGNPSPLAISLKTGFIVRGEGIISIIFYYISLYGPLLFTLLLSFYFLGKRYILLLLIFLIPLLTANFVQFTGNILMNHKYIYLSMVLSYGFASLPLAYLIRHIKKGYPGALALIIRGRRHIWYTLSSQAKKVPSNSVKMYGDSPEIFKRKKLVLKWLFALSLLLICATGIFNFSVFIKRNSRHGTIWSLHHPIISWIEKNTDPDDIFVTSEHISHPILLCGRRLYMGHMAFAKSAGYNGKERKEEIRRILSLRDKAQMKNRLENIGVKFLAVDNSLREIAEIKENEKNIARFFPMVFHNRMDNIKIFKVR